MFKDRRSFFERLTGAVKVSDYDYDDENNEEDTSVTKNKSRIEHKTPLAVEKEDDDWDSVSDPADLIEEDIDGELALDMYDTGEDLIIKTMVAGVKPEDLDVSISRDSVTIKGKREHERTSSDHDHHFSELYWGSFSRTISLPAEIEVEESEAIEKHGLLVLKLPKIDKNRQTKLKVRGS